MNQLSLFNDTNINFLESKSFDLKPIEVSFRDLIPEITDTSYLTHSIYYYPAKFIP